MEYIGFGSGSAARGRKKRKATDVGLIMMWPSFQKRIIHARVVRRIVASVSIQTPDGVFHVVHSSRSKHTNGFSANRERIKEGRKIMDSSFMRMFYLIIHGAGTIKNAR